MHCFISASFCILIAQLIVQPDYWEGDVLNRFVVILTDLSSSRYYKVDSWQLLSVNFSSLALISMYVLFWKVIQHVQPEYFSKKTTCLTREGSKVPIWNGRCSRGSGSVVREKSIIKGETVKEQRQDKMKKKKITSRPVDSFSVSFAQRKPFDPPPPTTAVPLPLLYSVLTLRQKSKTSPKRFKTTPKFVTFKLSIYSNILSASSSYYKWVPVGVWSRGEVLPIMVYTERLRPKWVPFSGFRSGIWKGMDFTCWSIWKGREISHFGR